MPYMLVYTFYSGDDLVGVDAKVVPNYIHPLELFSEEIVAPSTSDLAVISLSDIDSPVIEWIVPFGMVSADGQDN